MHTTAFMSLIMTILYYKLFKYINIPSFNISLSKSSLASLPHLIWTKLCTITHVFQDSILKIPVLNHLIAPVRVPAENILGIDDYVVPVHAIFSSEVIVFRLFSMVMMVQSSTHFFWLFQLYVHALLFQNIQQIQDIKTINITPYRKGKRKQTTNFCNNNINTTSH